MDKVRLTCIGVVAASLAMNVVQYNSVNRLEAIKEIYNAKDKVISNSFDEIIYQTMLKNQQDTSFQNGRVEGLVMALSGIKVPDSDNSAVWHNGYYQGLSQGVDQEIMTLQIGYKLAVDDLKANLDEKRLEQHVLNRFKDRDNMINSKVAEWKGEKKK